MTPLRAALLPAMLTMLVLAACVKQAPCAVADSVQPLRTLRLQGQPHTLVLRVAGLQDKQASYELYAGDAPVFDACGTTATPWVAQVIADAGQSVAVLQVQARRLTLRYHRSGAPPADPAHIAIELP